MSDIIKNSKYAPGISTYGIKGEQGEIGQAGYSLYFIPYNGIEDGIPNDDLKNNIKNNTFITDNDFFDINSKNMKNRKYQVNDLFLQPDGKIYRLNDIESILFDKYPIINITEYFDNFIIDSDNKIISNYDGYKLVIGDSSNIDLNNLLSLLTIKSSDSNNYISLISNTNNYFNIKGHNMSNLNILQFESDASSGIISNNFYIKDDCSINSIDVNNEKYYKAITNKIINSNDIEYTYNNDLLTINSKCEYRYILKNDDNNIIISKFVDSGTIINDVNEIKYKSFELYIQKTDYITKYIKII